MKFAAAFLCLAILLTSVAQGKVKRTAHIQCLPSNSARANPVMYTWCVPGDSKVNTLFTVSFVFSGTGPSESDVPRGDSTACKSHNDLSSCTSE